MIHASETNDLFLKKNNFCMFTVRVTKKKVTVKNDKRQKKNILNILIVTETVSF